MTKHFLFSSFPVVTQENKHQKLQNEIHIAKF